MLDSSGGNVGECFDLALQQILHVNVQGHVRLGRLNEPHSHLACGTLRLQDDSHFGSYVLARFLVRSQKQIMALNCMHLT